MSVSLSDTKIGPASGPASRSIDLAILEIKPEELRPSVEGLLAKGGRLIYASGADMGVRGIRLDYYFGFDHLDKGRHEILRTYLDRENPAIKSITPITRQADWSEREIIEFLGIKVEEHPDPRHLWLPLDWEDMYASGRPEADPATERIKTEHTPYVKDNITALQISTIPYGPYHPAFIQSNYLKMSVEDEWVKKVDLKLGFNHRSIVKLMERRDYYKDVFLSERVCGLCNAHHSQTFSMAVESIGNFEVPLRARLIRTLVSELERVQSHLLALGLMGDLMGYRTMFMHGMRIREDVQDAFELITGQRVTHGINTIGGVRRDITPAQADFVLSKVKALEKSVPELYDQAVSNDVLAGRFDKVGKLKYDAAVSLGAVGPIARGSGWKVDIRKNSPYNAYEDVDWDIITENGGDCMARLKVRFREAMMSLHIIEQCCDKIKSGSGPILAKVHELPCAEAIGKSEAPRGELMYHITSNGTNTPDAVRIRTPSFRNSHIMLLMLQGAWVGDVPAVIGSIDPCFSCSDRVTLLRGDRVDVTDLYELGAMKR